MTYLASPSYIWKGYTDRYDALIAAKPAIMVINPKSGAGSVKEPEYEAITRKAQAAGIKVLAYVSMDYLTRPWTDVEAEAKRCQDWYNPDGLFLDEMDNSGSPESLIRANGMRQLASFVCGNPGATLSAAYLPYGDLFMTFEGSAAKYLTSTRPSWEAKYPEKVWHCVYDCPATSLEATKFRMTELAPGYGFITDDGSYNPYDTNPGYLADLTRFFAPWPPPAPASTGIKLDVTLPDGKRYSGSLTEVK